MEEWMEGGGGGGVWLDAWMEGCAGVLVGLVDGGWMEGLAGWGKEGWLEGLLVDGGGGCGWRAGWRVEEGWVGWKGVWNGWRDGFSEPNRTEPQEEPP